MRKTRVAVKIALNDLLERLINEIKLCETIIK